MEPKESQTAEGKRMIRVELRKGGTIEGHFLGYQPAVLRFETAKGIVDVPFCLIPEDLQRVFPQDQGLPWVKVRELRRQVEALAEQLEELPDVGPLLDNANEALSASSQLLKDLEARLLVAQNKVATLMRENEELLKRAKI